mmetsp:Transcript_14955/g.34072  ORF Transcript_14955/g.34072 Transcript_14955/m.34072 type:complete len:342 (-) Transcript_14955:156-1181(-)
MALAGNAVVLTLAFGMASMGSWLLAALPAVSSMPEPTVAPITISDAIHESVELAMRPLTESTEQLDSTGLEVVCTDETPPLEAEKEMEEAAAGAEDVASSWRWTAFIVAITLEAPVVLSLIYGSLTRSREDVAVEDTALPEHGPKETCRAFRSSLHGPHYDNTTPSCAVPGDHGPDPNPEVEDDEEVATEPQSRAVAAADIFIPDDAIKKDLLASFNDERPALVEASPSSSVQRVECDAWREAKKAQGKGQFAPTGKLFLHAIASPCRSRVQQAQRLSLTPAKGNSDVLCSPYPKVPAASPDLPPRPSPATEPCKRAGSQHKKQEWKPLSETPARQTAVEA